MSFNDAKEKEASLLPGVSLDRDVSDCIIV